MLIKDANNQYTNITKYYDLWVTSGYYDYQIIAEEVNSIIGKGRKILELGVGTGLLAEKYLDIDPSCEFIGVDFTASMLEIAKKRLGDRAKLIEADAVTMNLEQQFEVAISNGGVWGILDLGETWEFGGHIPNIENNVRGLENLANHLQKDGLLLLHLQKPHKTYDKELSEGIIYSQSIEEIENTKDYYTLLKSYFFKKDRQILAQEKITITCFKPDISKKLLSDAGFELQGVSEREKFAIYKKVKV